MFVVGITGTLGAGKGTIVEYLTSKYHFKHFSVRAYLTNILVSRGIAPDRDQFTILANSLRQQHQSPSYIIEQLYHEASKSNQNCIIESIRTVGEIHTLRALGPFVLIAVDAPSDTRYQRILSRNSETDHISFDTFLHDEEREFNTDDPNKQNLSACIALADVLLSNDGPIEALHAQIDEAIKPYL